MGTYFNVVTKIRENAPVKANDLRLVSREPQEHLGPERYIHTKYVIDHSPLGPLGPMKPTTEMNLTG